MIESLYTLEERLSNHLNKDIGYKLTMKDYENMESQVDCHICKKSLFEIKQYDNGKIVPIVRDHVSL